MKPRAWIAKNLEVLFSPRDEHLSLERVGATAYAGLTEAALLDPRTDVRRLTSYAGFGLGPDEPIVVGPESRSPLLAQLSDE